MTVAALKASLAAKPGAVASALPSAPGVLIYKVMDKMFAILETRRIEAVILKCEPQTVEILRQHYTGVGHCSQPLFRAKARHKVTDHHVPLGATGGTRHEEVPGGEFTYGETKKLLALAVLMNATRH
jgi:hypothetical protein